MKKTLLLSFIAVACGMNSYSQNAGIPQSLKPIPLSNKGIAKALPAERAKGAGIELPVNNNPSHRVLSQHQNTVNTVNKTAGVPYEEKIGDTQYDLQTNEAILNRFIVHSDGTMSAAWTYTPFGDAPTGPTRGTGYNYYDGSAWGAYPTTRIEPTQRTGFTNIVVTSSGKEMAIAHSSTVPGMLLTARPTKGTGAWTEYPAALGMFTNDTWAKAISGGATGESVHAIWQGSGVSGVPINGQDGPMFYSRSDDGGATWPVLRTIIPSTDATHYLGFGGDNYSIDTKGDEVAIVLGDWTTDLMLLKSMDNGNNWTTTIITSFPIPLYDDATMMFPDNDGDGLGDDIENNSGDAHVMIDNNGQCHVWFSKVLIHDADVASALTYTPNGNDGLYYWNEGFGANPPALIALSYDYNGNGMIDIPVPADVNGMGNYRGGITQMPTSGIDAAGNLYISYQSFDERTDTTFYPGVGHKHVYVMKSNDNGVSWSCPYDVDAAASDSLIQEGVFACMAKNVDGNIHLIYQRDYAPGHALSANTVEAGWNTDPSDIVYVSIPVGDVGGVCPLLSGINDNLSVNDFSVAQNVPNPATGITSIGFSVAKTDKVTFTVTDVVGKVIYTEDRGMVSPGTYSFNFNTNQINKGLYFYTVKAGDNTITKKMIVE